MMDKDLCQYQSNSHPLPLRPAGIPTSELATPMAMAVLDTKLTGALRTVEDSTIPIHSTLNSCAASAVVVATATQMTQTTAFATTH
jgi:hypothetical protein